MPDWTFYFKKHVVRREQLAVNINGILVATLLSTRALQNCPGVSCQYVGHWHNTPRQCCKTCPVSSSAAANFDYPKTPSTPLKHGSQDTKFLKVLNAEQERKSILVFSGTGLSVSELRQYRLLADLFNFSHKPSRKITSMHTCIVKRQKIIEEKD